MTDTVNDFFSEYTKGGFADVVLVPAGTYTVELKAKARKSGDNGGIYVEGTITEGPYAGQYISVFGIWFSKEKGGGDIAVKNLAAIGIDRASLNNLVQSLGVQPDDPRFTEALAPSIDGRVVVVEIEVNDYKGSTSNRMAIGKATYKGGGTAVGAGTAAAIPQAVPQAPPTAVPPAAAPAVAVAPAPVAPAAEVPVSTPAPAVLPQAPAAPVAAPPVQVVAEAPAAAFAAPAAAPAAPVAAAAPAAVEPF